MSKDWKERLSEINKEYRNKVAFNYGRWSKGGAVEANRWHTEQIETLLEEKEDEVIRRELKTRTFMLSELHEKMKKEVEEEYRRGREAEKQVWVLDLLNLIDIPTNDKSSENKG